MAKAEAIRMARNYVLGTVAALGIAVGLVLYVQSENNQQTVALEKRVTAQVEAAVQSAIAVYDREKRAEIARDEEAVQAFYESTVREVDSYVSWRIDEALRESNRIIEDAIRDAELIRSETVGTSKIGATE